MERNTVLLQLMGMRMENAMGRLTQNDTCYQESMHRSGEYSDKLDRLGLPKGTRLLIDQYVSKHNANVMRFSELAYPYQLGFSDCRELLLEKMPFPCIKEMD